MAQMIPSRGRRDLERVGTCPHTVERKSSQLRTNLEVEKAVRGFAPMNSELKYAFAEMKTPKRVRDYVYAGAVSWDRATRSSYD
jgi:hypothetical protein